MSLFSALSNLNVRRKKIVYQVKELVSVCKSSNQKLVPLPDKDRYLLDQHFNKKIQFDKKQNDTKWGHWPKKPFIVSKLIKSAAKRIKNYKKRHNRKLRKTEKDAKKALETGCVVILVNETIPNGALAVLGKGLGYIPTPNVNTEESRLDMRLNTNRILNASRSNLRTYQNSGNNVKSESTINKEEKREFDVPPRLRRRYYSKGEPSPEGSINDIVNTISQEHDNRLNNGKKTVQHKQNLSKHEQDGLAWLTKQVNENKLAIVPADKGGATLIVYPSLLRKKVLEKLQNESLYEKLPRDPIQTLHGHLFKIWVKGKNNDFVTPAEAKEVIGISDNPKKDGSSPTNRPSTSIHYHPGKPYFYPSMKIHKLSKDQLKPGLEPQIRLITALHEGVTKRSDTFIAQMYLKDLEKEYCKDLLSDTTDALIWLENINSTHDPNNKKTYKSFTFDFKSLYDSLSPSLVIEALQDAIRECRTDWSPEFIDWIVELVSLSLKSSVGTFEDCWYRQRNGVPTGGTLCVQLANMTVYYILSRAIYSDKKLMEKIASLKRYIDDGSGTFTGTKRQFSDWIRIVNSKLARYGLNIDESTIEDPNSPVAFLDIQFCFDHQGNLQTDLYVKETDARAYLDFSSCHPNHVLEAMHTLY